jgi:hypothetical protein
MSKTDSHVSTSSRTFVHRQNDVAIAGLFALALNVTAAAKHEAGLS